jgi:hypothetical protein
MIFYVFAFIDEDKLRITISYDGCEINWLLEPSFFGHSIATPIYWHWLATVPESLEMMQFVVWQSLFYLKGIYPYYQGISSLFNAPLTGLFQGCASFFIHSYRDRWSMKSLWFFICTFTIFCLKFFFGTLVAILIKKYVFYAGFMFQIFYK